MGNYATKRRIAKKKKIDTISYNKPILDFLSRFNKNRQPHLLLSRDGQTILSINREAERVLKTSTLEISGTSLIDQLIVAPPLGMTNQTHEEKILFLSPRTAGTKAFFRIIVIDETVPATKDSAPPLTDLTISQIKTPVQEEKKERTLLLNFAHEVRSPLHGALGNLDLLKERFHHDGNSLSIIGEIETCLNHQMQVINETLTERKEAGKPSKRDIVNLIQLGNEVIKIVNGGTKGKPISLSINTIGCSAPIVLSDATKLKQILLNFLSNAVKYTDSGSVTLSISNDIVNHGKSNFTFKISDTGPGISEEDLQLFFARKTRFGKKQKNSSGLGTNIALELTSGMGGNIHVNSTVNIGTEVIITIPLEVLRPRFTPTYQTRTSTPIEELGSPLLPPLHTPAELLTLKKSVLIADDDTISSKCLARWLTKLGFKCDLASSGEEALRKYNLKHSFYACVFLDCHMPLMNGIDVIKKIKRSGHFKTHPPIIMISCNDDDNKTALQEGANLCLPKPFNKIKLIQAFKTLGIPIPQPLVITRTSTKTPFTY